METAIGSSRLLAIYEGETAGFMSVNQLSELSADALAGIDMIFGHMAYGLHQNFNRKCTYVAFLRHPFEFMLSYFLFKKYVACDKKYEDVDIFQAMSTFEDPNFNNCYTRMLLNKLEDLEALTCSDFESAVEILKRDFEFVGIQENFVQSVEKLSAYLRG